MTTAQAAPYLSLYWGGAIVGRFVGVGLMRFMAPGRLLAVHAALAVALIGLQASFAVPALCYAGIALYGWRHLGLFK